MKNRLIAMGVLAVAGLVWSAPAFSQAAPAQGKDQVLSSQDIEVLRKDIRSQKKQLIAANLKLTDAEATKFWPVYDDYTKELVTINDKKYGLIQQYANAWGTMTNDQALLFARQWTDVDAQVVALRQKYIPIFNKVVDGKTTATFIQLDRRISMMIDLQLASQIPLVQSQDH